MGMHQRQVSRNLLFGKVGRRSKYFDVYIDGVKTGSIKSANGGVEKLPAASGLADGVHNVALGINDFSTSPNPSQAQYCGGYSNFVRSLRGYYPSAHIICTYLSSMAGIASSYIQSVVTASGHTKIANAFIPVFDGIMGTNCGSAPHGTPLTWLRSYGFNVWTDSAPASGRQVIYRVPIPAR